MSFSPKSRLSKGVCVVEESGWDFISVQSCLGSCLQTAACFSPSALLHTCSTQLLVHALSCFWRKVLVPETQLRVFFLSETRKAYCIMDQLRENYANQSNHLVQLRNLNILFFPLPHLFHSHFLLLWLEDIPFAKENPGPSQRMLLQKRVSGKGLYLRFAIPQPSRILMC